MKKSVIAAIAAVVVIGSTAVYAQHRHHHQPRLSTEDRSAFVDARIAAVKAGLQLTLEQEKSWPPVEAAVRDFAKQRIALANARASEREARRAKQDQAGPGDRGSDQALREKDWDPVAKLRERADAMAATATGLKRIADAAEPLYKTLNDGQKRRLAVLARMGGKHGFRGHGMDGGFGPGSDFGPDRDHGPGPGRNRGPDGPQRL